MHNLQKWQLECSTSYTVLSDCVHSSHVSELQLLLVFSILIFNVSLVLLYSITGRRFHHTNSSCYRSSLRYVFVTLP